MSEVKYPNIEVQLTGEDGNVFSIISRVAKALRRGGEQTAAAELYQKLTDNEFESYDAVLQHVMSLVTVY